MRKIICGYVVNTRPKFLLPSTVLLSNEKESITVEMAKDAIDYILGRIAQKNQLYDGYRRAKIVLEAFKAILENKTPKYYSKEDAKIALDVFEEIINENTCNENERLYNSQMALRCKLVIDGFCM